MMTLTAIYDREILRPYEVIRYRVVREDGAEIGYASRYHHDGVSCWRAWRDDGLRQDTGSRKRAISILMASAQ